jgi:hypothetical protein
LAKPTLMHLASLQNHGLHVKKTASPLGSVVLSREVHGLTCPHVSHSRYRHAPCASMPTDGDELGTHVLEHSVHESVAEAVGVGTINKV